MFIWAKGDLTKEQEDAVNEPGNVLLIACPGSGKTRALTYKIAFELSKINSAKHYIVAITYTNNAAEEIKERIELLGVDTSQLWIGTIHAFCTEWILRPYGLYHPDLLYGFRVFNSHESELLLNTICAKKYPHSNLSSYDCTYQCLSDGYVLTGSKPEKHEHAEQVLIEYWRYLSENRIVDFELILFYSFELLRDHPTISNTLSKIFHHILVDEFQDTKELQYQVLCKILAANPSTTKAFIVGDPNQSIYGTLGGYAIGKEKLEELSKCKFEPYQLSENFRSSSKIIGYFDHFRTFPNNIVGKGRNKDYGSLISYTQDILKANLETEIVRLIQYNVTVLKISPNEICVLAPQWTHLAALTRNLMAKLPEFSFNGPGMAPFARDIENFFYKLCRILLTEPAPNLYVSRLRWANEVIKELDKVGVDISQTTPKRFLKLCNSLDVIETEGLIYLEKSFSKIFDTLKTNLEIYPSLLNDYNSFFESSEHRIQRLRQDGNEFITTTENFKKVFKQKDGISVSTMHGVKGLEFDTVIAFGLLEDYVPHFSDVDGTNSAKKMLYVIASRAKLNLHLISERRKKAYSRPARDMFSTFQLAEYAYIYDEC